ncbi:hypothetical protein B0H10DRAFT_1944896 [Mycena sp. CBHHK59/15]|nr:hypothetical protein B0H10DRAFT_1944896 [Mycena sp. CBHHK59/15]
MLSLSLLVISLGVTASSLVIDSFITFPISKRVNLTGTETLLSHDLARVNYLLAHATVKPGTGISELDSNQSEPIASNGLHSHYTASIGIGSPPSTLSTHRGYDDLFVCTLMLEQSVGFAAYLKCPGSLVLMDDASRRYLRDRPSGPHSGHIIDRQFNHPHRPTPSETLGWVVDSEDESDSTSTSNAHV